MARLVTAYRKKHKQSRKLMRLIIQEMLAVLVARRLPIPVHLMALLADVGIDPSPRCSTLPLAAPLRLGMRMCMVNLPAAAFVPYAPSMRLANSNRMATWPHSVERRGVGNSHLDHAPVRVVESRKLQELKFELFDPADTQRRADDIVADLVRHIDDIQTIRFGVSLVHADDGSPVTLGTLANDAMRKIHTVASCNALSTNRYTLDGTTVTATPFRLNVRSSMTMPPQRAFKYVLWCETHPNLLACTESPAFYCKSKSSLVAEHA